MASAVLDATERSSRGKNEARRLRAGGRIPAVFYGEKEGGKAIAVDPKGLARILRTEQGANTLIALNLPGGGSAQVLVKEYQLDPITHELLHADFYRVAMDKVLRVQVTVVAQGEPKGVKQQGGVLDIVHRQVEIECLPADIPNHIVVDVSELMVGQSVRVKDVATNPKWKALSDPEMMILHVIIPKVEEVAPAPGTEVAAGAAATPAEPEVIKKGKKEEEAAEAAPAAAAGKKEKK
jgi:large subunit ribosomal protein L25